MRIGILATTLAYLAAVLVLQGNESEGPPVKDKPWVAARGYFRSAPEAWRGMHEANLRRAREGGIDLLFLGDSITQGWQSAGRAVWEPRLAPFKAANFGISGDSTRQLLYRIEHGEVEGLRPKVVVLMIGTNNLYGDFNAGTDSEVVKGIRAVVGQLRERLPGSRLLLLGILPRENRHFGQRIANINAALRELDDGMGLRFLDLTPHFQVAPGRVVEELYEPDTVHLRAAGYEVWADAMKGLLDGMMRG